MRLCTLRFVLGCNSIPAGEKLPAKSSLMPPSILTSTRDDILALLTSQDPSSGVRSGSEAAEEQQQFDLQRLPHALPQADSADAAVRNRLRLLYKDA